MYEEQESGESSSQDQTFASDESDADESEAAFESSFEWFVRGHEDVDATPATTKSHPRKSFPNAATTPIAIDPQNTVTGEVTPLTLSRTASNVADEHQPTKHMSTDCKTVAGDVTVPDKRDKLPTSSQ